MNYFDHATTLLDKQLGDDVVVSLATCANNRVTVRNVDGYYKGGALYVITNAKSNKMKQIAQQPNVGLCKNFSRTRPFHEGLLEATGQGENIGHPRGHTMEPELREVFRSFYGRPVEEDDPHSCILKINLDTAVIYDGEYRFTIDFSSQTAVMEPCQV